MRVLVTGATGFVASHLVPALASQGHDVLALGHDASRLPEGDGVEAVEADLTESRAFPAADAVVHLAQANVPFPDGAGQLFAVNTASTVALLEHARACGARRFVYASSASVYGFGESVFAEDDVPRAADFYSATKLASERLVAAYAQFFPAIALRFVAPFGPGQRNRLIPRLLERVRTEQPIALTEGGRPRMNPVYVDDVVRTISTLLASDEAGVLNVGGDDVVSIRDLGELLGEALGTAPVFEQAPGAAAGDLVVDNSRLKALLGGGLLPLREGLRRTVEATAAV